jgi:hypothetical protein
MEKLLSNQKVWIIYRIIPGLSSASVRIIVSKRKAQCVYLNNVPKEWTLDLNPKYTNKTVFEFRIPLPTNRYEIENNLKCIYIEKSIDFAQDPEFVSSELLRILN